MSDNKPKFGSDGNIAHRRLKNEKYIFWAPKPGLEKIIFDYSTGSVNIGAYLKSILEDLGKHLEVSFKKYGLAESMAVKDTINPKLEIPKNPKAVSNQVKIHKLQVGFNR